MLFIWRIQVSNPAFPPPFKSRNENGNEATRVFIYALAPAASIQPQLPADEKNQKIQKLLSFLQTRDLRRTQESIPTEEPSIQRLLRSAVRFPLFFVRHVNI